MNWNDELDAETAHLDRLDDLQWIADFHVLEDHCLQILSTGTSPLDLATDLLVTLHDGPNGEPVHDDFVDAYYRWGLPIVLRACTAALVRSGPLPLARSAGAAMVK